MSCRQSSFAIIAATTCLSRCMMYPQLVSTLSLLGPTCGMRLCGTANSAHLTSPTTEGTMSDNQPTGTPSWDDDVPSALDLPGQNINSDTAPASWDIDAPSALDESVHPSWSDPDADVPSALDILDEGNS